MVEAAEIVEDGIAGTGKIGVIVDMVETTGIVEDRATDEGKIGGIVGVMGVG